jgi:hypothetical protein
MIIVKGLPQKAVDFLSNNSTFNTYQPGQKHIGCKNSDGRRCDGWLSSGECKGSGI